MFGGINVFCPKIGATAIPCFLNVTGSESMCVEIDDVHTTDGFSSMDTNSVSYLGPNTLALYSSLRSL